jgi:hypothetical protein
LYGLTPRGMQRAVSLRDAARRAALMLAFVAFSGCSNLVLPREDMPAIGMDPSYGAMIAGYIRSTLKNSASYDAFEMSDTRWVHAVKGWSWLVCVRFQDQGHRRTYAFFIKEKTIVDSRYAVQSDTCGAQTYSPFNLMIDATGPGAVGVRGPLY